METGVKILTAGLTFLGFSAVSAAFAVDSKPAWATGVLVILAVVLAAPVKREEKLKTKLEGETEKVSADNANLIERLRPKLVISCDPQDARCRVVHPYKEAFPAVWLRAVVVTDGAKPITNCSAKLISIRKDDGTAVMDHEVRDLAFTPGHEGDAFKKRIAPSIPYTVDVLLITDDNIVRIGTFPRKTEKTAEGKDVFERPGLYAITIAVSGDETNSKDAVLKFEWTGDWQTARLSLAS